MADTNPFGAWGEPAFTVVFGPVGCGKTTDVMLADLGAWVLGAPGATKGVQTLVGPQIYAAMQSLRVPCEGFADIANFLVAMKANKVQKRNVIIDDISLKAQSELVRLQGQIARSDTFYIWDLMKRNTITIRNLARQAGVHVFSTGHRRDISVSRAGKLQHGGPDMGGPQGTNMLVTDVDVVYEAIPEPVGARFPYSLSYHCDPAAQMSHKDRHSVIHGKGPANLREIFRVAGIPLSRISPFAWMEDHVKALTDKLAPLEDDARRALCRTYMEKQKAAGVYPGHAFMVVRDAFARLELQEQPSIFDSLLSATASAAVVDLSATAPNPLKEEPS
jgi:hypothetical protein